VTQPAEPTPVDNTADDPAAADPTTDASKKPDAEPEPTNSEAARYRVERNEARTERDALAERLTGYQRRECEAVIADLLEVPADLWEIAQADVVAFYNEDGTVNEAELRAAAGALVEQRPRLALPNRTPSWGQHSGDGGFGDGKASWGDVIKPI
jgi:hypothetical protein